MSAHKLSLNQRALLSEIAEGYKGWRPGCATLERKGFIREVNYANGPHAEMTDAGHDALDARP